MSTEYYLYPKGSCPTCGHLSDRVVIGTSSSGWCFALNGLHTLEAWKGLFYKPGCVIENEYGDRLTAAEMLEIITNKVGGLSFDSASRWSFYKDEAHFHNINQSMRGPNNLLRRRIGDYCIAHGDGTYDIMKASEL